MTRKTAGIVGTGMIGSSVGLRLSELGWSVTGHDVDAAACTRAVERGAIGAAVTLEDLYRDSDVIVLASHLRGTLFELARMRGANAPRASLVLDVASVKGPVVRSAQGLPNFVASHPMAGSERSGPGAAAADLFAEKTWLYVPTSDAQLDERAERFISGLGAQPVAVDADRHDAIVALTSHVPQILATVFSARLAGHEHADDIVPYCGPTARELVRLSRSNPAMWHDILQANRANIVRELRALTADLTLAADALDARDVYYFDDAFERAREAV